MRKHMETSLEAHRRKGESVLSVVLKSMVHLCCWLTIGLCGGGNTLAAGT